MKLTIGKKMGLNTAIFSLAAIVPFIILGVMAVSTARDSFVQERFEQLISIREIKKDQIEKFFFEKQHNMGVLIETLKSFKEAAYKKLSTVQELKKTQVEDYFTTLLKTVNVLKNNPTTIQAVKKFGKAYTAEDDKTGGIQWTEVEEEFGPIFTDMMADFGYYDIFLITENGDVVYTVTKESDLGENILKGRLKDSGLAHAFKKAESKEIAIVDFKPYAPSGNVPASFISASIKDNYGNRIGVVAIQVPTKPINRIVQKRDGMGETGETYLVGKADGKTAFRSDMVTMGNGKYVIGYNITTSYIEKALEGEEGQDVFTDSDGNLVMVAYNPLNIKGLNWACISKINLEEAIAPRDEGSQDDYFTKYIDQYGYYDLFLVHPDGKVFYSVTREADYGTNMVNGKYADSGLGKLIREVLKSGQYEMGDFEPYAPSNNEPAAFIAQPIIHNEEIELIVALQLSKEGINSIMQQREGLGKTGETYLVGSDKLMRSDSYLDPQNHSVKASFADPAKGSVDTEATRDALSGKSDQKIVIDYNGNPVLSAYTPIRIGDTTWVLLAEIDEKEVVSESKAAENLLRRVWIIGGVSGMIILSVILMSIFIVRNLSGTLMLVTSGMNEGSEQVASASGQVSSSSQQLAEGSSEQAASLEETSSSLEEMSSITMKNAEHASQADSLMSETNQVVRKANDSMTELTDSMDEISKASEETSKIIKTIDEIAFQTNLLALNAAVEAARAGEAGAGFAVVADEVRNLAMRAADAAGNTSDLIEDTVKKIKDGSELVTITNDAFAEVAESSIKIGELVGEISAASNEQAQGIEEVNKAVAEMDKVVQQNSANAEESASAAEELNAQAEQMKIYVEDLVAIVGGNGEKRSKDFQSQVKVLDTIKTKALTIKKKSVLPNVHEVSPDHVIPIDDADLKDF